LPDETVGSNKRLKKIQMVFKKKERILIYITIFIVSIFLMEKFAISSLKLKLKRLRQQVKLQEVKLKKELEMRRRKNEIDSEYKHYQSYLKTGDSDREAVGKFLKEVERIAKSSAVSIASLNPTVEPEQIEGYKKYKVNLRADVNMEQVSNFLYKVQESNLLIKVDKFSLASKNAMATSLRMDATISIAIPL